MQVVRILENVWGISQNRVTSILDDQAPRADLVTAGFALAFDGENVLLTFVDRPGRGWEVPGGHVEPGESVREAIHRKVMEEAGAEIELLGCIGHDRYDDLAKERRSSHYPFPTSYMVFYAARVMTLQPFSPSEECTDRRLFTPEEAMQQSWVSHNSAYYHRAREVSLTRSDWTT